MGVNKRMLIVYGLLILLLWIGNCIYYITGDIKEPLIIKQYTEAELYAGETFSIYYITTDEKERIPEIAFPEISDEEMWSNEEEVQRDGRYILKRILIEKEIFLHAYPHLKEWGEDAKGEPIKLTKMRIHPRGKEPKEVDIGEIYLSPVGENIEPILFTSSGRRTSRDGAKRTTKETYTAADDIEVLAPTGIFIEQIKKYFNIYINEEPLESLTFPIALGQGDKLEVMYESKEDKKLIDGLYTGLLFEVEDSRGNKEIVRSSIREFAHRLPFYERSFIQALKKEAK